jgi:twitching motility two-component system response regulator PilH
METTSQGTVIIIEDEPVFRLIYRGVLKNAGYTVLEAPDGASGWEIIRTQKPDLVLLDLILPKMSGHDVLHSIRSTEATKNIPVIVFSVMGQEKDIEKTLAMGANAHRLKGMESPEKILSLIRDTLKKRGLPKA